jgi:hypothetical protein
MLLSLQVGRALLQPDSICGGKLPALYPDVLKAAEFGAEAETIDAELERWAVTVEEALKEGFELKGASDGSLDFAELAGGEFFPARADRGAVAQAVQEELDFGEGKTHFSGEADQQYARKGIACVTALAAETLGRGKKATFFVVTDGGGVEVGASGEFADFHGGAP